MKQHKNVSIFYLHIVVDSNKVEKYDFSKMFDQIELDAFEGGLFLDDQNNLMRTLYINMPLMKGSESLISFISSDTIHLPEKSRGTINLANKIQKNETTIIYSFIGWDYSENYFTMKNNSDMLMDSSLSNLRSEYFHRHGILNAPNINQ